ncbi:MAG: hypothetical protein HY064_09585 [Bacteroidetes bacterium]|nr:hypothetical protein [Bacteroidota bacterium]
MKNTLLLFFIFISGGKIFSQTLTTSDTVLFSTTGDTVLMRGTVVRAGGGNINTFFSIYKKAPRADSCIDVAKIRLTNTRAMGLSDIPADTIKKYHLYNKGVKMNFDSIPGSSFKAMELEKEDKGPNPQDPSLEIYASTFFYTLIAEKKILLQEEKFQTVYEAKQDEGVNRSDIVLVSAFKMVGGSKYFIFVGVKRTHFESDGTMTTDMKLKRFIL